MNVSRKLPGGERVDEERVNKSQIYVNISITIEQSIAENPLNCWEALQIILKVISSQAFYKKEGSTTISKESTQQAMVVEVVGP